MAGVWPRHLQMQSSNWRELRTILYTLQQAHKKQVATGHRALDGTVLYAFTDNAVSASSINKGTSKSPALMRLVRGLREFEALLGCHVVSVWISGKAIIEQGTDDLSRGVHDKGALAPDAPAPLTFSPIDQACPAPEAALVANVVASFPVPALHLTAPADWADAPHPGRPVVITPPTSLARSAIDQVLRWSAARPYTTGVAIILPNDYASSWGRLSRYFTRVYFARAGMLGRPEDAVGAMAVLYLLPHLDKSHDQVQFAAAPPTGGPLPSLSRYRLAPRPCGALHAWGSAPPPHLRAPRARHPGAASAAAGAAAAAAARHRAPACASPPSLTASASVSGRPSWCPRRRCSWRPSSSSTSCVATRTLRVE